MVQPFLRALGEYRSSLWPELTICTSGDHILMEYPGPMSSLNSAVWGGGVKEARRVVNWKVPLDFRCEEPAEAMGQQLMGWGYDPSDTVGLMTAAHLTTASIQEEKGDCFRLLVAATAGIGNAARAGTVRPLYSAYRAGTVNLVVLIDGGVAPEAMVGAVMTASEGKAAAMQDLGITDREGRVATGTTSDAIVIANCVPLGRSEAWNRQSSPMVIPEDGYNAALPRPVHRYAGTATTLGDAIARLVYQAVREAVGAVEEAAP